MKTIIKYGMWAAWVVCALMISSALDDLPDYPAITKKAGLELSSRCSPDSQAAIETQNVDAHRSAGLAWAGQPRYPVAEEIVLLPSTQPLLCQAADSSPPSLA